MRNSIFATGMLAGILIALPVFAQTDKSKTAEQKTSKDKPAAKQVPAPNPTWNPYSKLQENKVVAAVDIDLDGTMTMKEIEGCVERIKKLDVNGDGKLDADEYLKEPPVNKYAPGFSIVKVLDANSDKIISAEEIAGAVEAIKTLDKNKDSKLISAEYAMASPASMGGEPGGGGGGAGGGGGGGGRQQPSPEEFVKQNDKDGDGKVQKKELTGMIVGFFDRMDTDKDGSVTVEEVKASRERQRQQNGGAGGGAGRGGPAPAGPGAAPPAEKKAETPKEETPKADAPK